jgi:hypothetical protein
MESKWASLQMKIFNTLVYSCILLLLVACETLDKKVNDTTEKETTMLTKFLGEESSAIRLTFGEPNKIDLEVPYKIYTYYKKNLLIKCTREFFINPKTDLVEKFNSKNCIQ